jgi:cysteine desulfurase
MIYFDNSSTTSVHPEVVRAFSQILENYYGNPDSLHAVGREAASNMEKSRNLIAKLLQVLPSEVIFTGSASESNTLATIGYAIKNQHRGKHILTSNVEHSSTTHAMDFLASIGFDVERLEINAEGKITPELVKEKLRKDTILVSIMHVNNEMGAINPVAEIADIVHTMPYAKFHIDAVQSFGKIDVPFDKADMVTISAHKIHGLKGSALLIKKRKVELNPVIFGGQQEQGLRGGTSNAPADIVLAKTIRLALQKQEEGYKIVSEISNYLREELAKMPGAHVHSPSDGLPYILNISFDQITSEVLLNALDQRGICVSAKSTCSSHDTNASEILLKMGKSEKDATHAIRLSFSSDNTLDEARQFLQAMKEIIELYGLPL